MTYAPKEALSRMPKFVIEREIPNAGSLTPEQLKAISQTSCGVLRSLGSQIQWQHSYVTDNKIYCVYIAPNEEMVREHARQGGFPANSVAQVRSIIDPTTSE
jgi:Protein of unknown function (DUF4242)